MAKKKKQTTDRRKKIIWAVIIFCVILVACCYKMLAIDRVTDESFTVYVAEDNTITEVTDQLNPYLSDTKIRFIDWGLRLSQYKPNRVTGAFRIDNTMTLARTFIVIYKGRQTPVRFTFNNLRTNEQLAQRISDQLSLKKDSVFAFLQDSVACKRFGFEPHTIKAMFIPDTYEVYWDITLLDLMERMQREYKAYWSTLRKSKAEEAGLTPLEVIILASIVEEETNMRDEMPMVAGLYINRLRKGMLLQADPTVKYALQDFSLRRIYLTHLQTESPYNTYKHKGLPPGPIRVPSKYALESVLNYNEHNYVYMCAKEDFSGRHNFAVTLNDHSQNAIRYHKALSQRNIQ